MAYAFSPSSCWMSKSFFTTRDEVNTCVAFHAVHVEELHPGITVIRCNETKLE